MSMHISSLIIHIKWATVESTRYKKIRRAVCLLGPHFAPCNIHAAITMLIAHGADRGTSEQAWSVASWDVIALVVDTTGCCELSSEWALTDVRVIKLGKYTPAKVPKRCFAEHLVPLSGARSSALISPKWLQSVEEYVSLCFMTVMCTSKSRGAKENETTAGAC